MASGFPGLRGLPDRLLRGELDSYLRIIITTGPTAYRRPDGIAIIPLALLGP